MVERGRRREPACIRCTEQVELLGEEGRGVKGMFGGVEGIVGGEG